MRECLAFNFGSISETISNATLDDVIMFGGGDVDTLTGGIFDDIIFGGAGDDILHSGGEGSEGDDLLGGAGNDTIYLDTVATATDVYGGAGTDTLYLTAGTSSLFVTTVENINGSASDDHLTFENTQSGTAIDLLGGTNDILTLSDGANSLTISNVETIVGGNSADTITLSGSSATTVTGNDGADIITASANADSFNYTATSHLGDTINSFTSGTDGFIFSRAAFNGDSGADGALDAFRIVASGTDSLGTEYFVFNPTDNNLYYDADASAGGTGVLVADMDAGVVQTDITFVA